MQKYLEDDENREQIEKMEKRVQNAVEGKKVTQTLDEVISAAQFRLRKDAEISSKLDCLVLAKALKKSPLMFVSCVFFLPPRCCYQSRPSSKYVQKKNMLLSSLGLTDR